VLPLLPLLRLLLRLPLLPGAIPSSVLMVIISPFHVVLRLLLCEKQVQHVKRWRGVPAMARTTATKRIRQSIASCPAWPIDTGSEDG
jgi:hypothetical protein